MATKRDGTATILKGARLICRMLGLYGVTGFAARTTPQFAAAVVALELACTAFDALDNYPGEIDAVPPVGVEDVV